MDIVTEESSPLPAPVPIQNTPHETYKALIGWANGQWSIEVRSSMISCSIEDHLQVISASKLAIASRPIFRPTNPIMEIEDNPFLDAINVRPETAYLKAVIKKLGASCRFAQVNLKDVLAFQPLVRIDDIENSHVQSDISDEQLYQICFPPNKAIDPKEVSIEFQDTECKITTQDPNIRVFLWGQLPFQGEIQLPRYAMPYIEAEAPFQIPLIPFTLIRHPNYFQVVEYQNRYFIRDGYHRGTRFLRQGIYTVPCLFIQASDLSQVGWKPEFIDLPNLFGPHPPYLSDFWDDSVTCSFVRPALQYVFSLKIGMAAIPIKPGD
jgi:hypothetical protein